MSKIRLAILFLIILLALVFIVIRILMAPAPVIASTGCIPPAGNWATLVACRTATAAGPQAATATPTSKVVSIPTATVTPEPFIPETYMITGGLLGVPYLCGENRPRGFPMVVYKDGTTEYCANISQGGPTPTRIVP